MQLSGGQSALTLVEQLPRLTYDLCPTSGIMRNLRTSSYEGASTRSSSLPPITVGRRVVYSISATCNLHPGYVLSPSSCDTYPRISSTPVFILLFLIFGVGGRLVATRCCSLAKTWPCEVMSAIYVAKFWPWTQSGSFIGIYLSNRSAICV